MLLIAFYIFQKSDPLIIVIVVNTYENISILFVERTYLKETRWMKWINIIEALIKKSNLIQVKEVEISAIRSSKKIIR